VHKGQDFECPLCSKRFKTPSSIAHHIESGTCHNISRAQVTAAVHVLNIVPTILVSRHIEGGSTHVVSDEYAFESDDDKDDDDDEEPFCVGCKRWFVDLASLYQHLATSLKHNWCFLCSRDFATPTLLDQVSPALSLLPFLY
jgi:C2H2-type zinc finger